MKYARIFNGFIGEVFTPPADISITECFTPEVVALFSLVPDDVEVGWIMLPDGSFTPPPAPAVETGPIAVTDLGA